MTAVLLVLGLGLTLAMVCVLAVLCRRVIARRSAGVPASTTSVLSVLPAPPACPEIDSLDDMAFRAWLGVLPASYDRYVDTGVEDLEIFLADHPARLGEDPPSQAA